MLLIPYLVIIPLVAAFLTTLVGKRLKVEGEVLSGLASFALVVISLILASLTMSGKAIVYKVGGWAPPAGISMVCDSLTAFMLVTVNLVTLMVAVYSISYVKKFTDRWKFHALFMLMAAGMNGVLISGDIFNLYVFLEIAALAGYFLVAFGLSASELEASFKYAVMGSVASIFILLGIGFLYSYTSTLNMADMANFLSGAEAPSRVIGFVSVLFLMGFGLKAALVPFHSWLAYAHSAAPAPISAMLSAVSIKVLGVYAIIRIFFNVLGKSPAVSEVLIALAVMSMVVSSVIAFGQKDIKRLFAYSSVGQVGYIALGLGIGTPLAILGALFHLFNHSFLKSLLFLTSGAIETSMGTRDLTKIRGILSRAPVAGYTSLTASLGICGMPPLGGFWSKLIIILACIQANRPGLAFVAVGVSVLTLGYYFKGLTNPLFGQNNGVSDNNTQRKKMAWAMGIPMVFLASLAMVSGAMLLPNKGNHLLKNAVSVVASGRLYADNVSGALK